MGDSFSHIFTTPYLFLLTLSFGGRGVGVNNVISKNYHMSSVTLISRKLCDKLVFLVLVWCLLKLHVVCRFSINRLSTCVDPTWLAYNCLWVDFMKKNYKLIFFLSYLLTFKAVIMHDCLTLFDNIHIHRKTIWKISFLVKVHCVLYFKSF
jgi:hypothetical protein